MRLYPAVLPSASVPPSFWYAVYTRHQHEKSVAQILAGKGFEVFLPLYATFHRRKDRNKRLYLPLFPCYAFLRGAPERRLDVITTPGINAVVSCAGQPVPIPSSEIEALRLVIQSGARVEPHSLLKCGDRVRVKCGVLEGVEGILIREKNLCRLILSVEMLGKAAAVEIDAYTVEKTGGNPPRAAVTGSRAFPQLRIPA
jgi:transcription antitermination factor NusG